MKLRAMLLIAVIVAGGCGAPSDRREGDREREARIQRELGLVQPYRLVETGFAADGGSAIVQYKDGKGKPLWILIDGRMHIQKSDADTIPLPRHVHLARKPDYEGSDRLDFDSPAESSVVDLFALTIRSLAPGRESTLVREWRRVVADPVPDVWREWRSSLPEREQQALRLMIMIEQLDRQRAKGRRSLP